MNIKQWIQGVLIATFQLKSCNESSCTDVVESGCDRLPKQNHPRDMLTRTKKPKSRKKSRSHKKLKKAA